MLSVPLTVVTLTVGFHSLYAMCPLAVQIWAGVAFGVLFSVGGMGFWGAVVFVRLIARVCDRDLRFNPYHPDGLGGFGCIRDFNIKGPLLFFSGSLVFPIAIEAFDKLSGSESINYLAWGAVASFMGFGLAAFLIPQFWIQKTLVSEKEQCLAESEVLLQSLLQPLRPEAPRDVELAQLAQVRVDTYYKYCHKRIQSVREWPFNWSVFAQLTGALVIPIIITAVEGLLG